MSPATLYGEIVHRARAAGPAGASVFRGVEGHRASGLVHTSRLLGVSGNLPVAVVVVDTAERIEAFPPELDEPAVEGLVPLDDVHGHRYVGRATR